MRRYLILEGEISAEDWRKAINDTLWPEYWWLHEWKSATCCVNTYRARGGYRLELESFFIALGIGSAIEKHYPVRIRDAGNDSPQMRAIVEWFKGSYSDLTLVPQHPASAIASEPVKRKRKN